MWLREDAGRMRDVLAYYRDDHAEDFIDDWGQTFSPWNVAKGLPAKIPFVLFPKQKELIRWALTRWRRHEPGLCDKSRETGVSWVMCALLATLCMFNKGFVGGFGSRKLELVDKTGSPDSLFWKTREFIAGIPREFRAGWDRNNDAGGRITFGNGSVLLGEGGDHIGRGGRTSLYVVDEAAYIEHPDMVDASLSANTLCRIDVSSAHGMGNSFATRRHQWPRDGFSERVFTFHWRDDPRKDQAWYDLECTKWDPIVIAQEHDINYMASVEGILIPSAWVQASIDLHVHLGLEPTGGMRASLDIADEGPDKNALAVAKGWVVQCAEDWSGKNSDIYQTVLKAFRICDELGTDTMVYDADGMGASVRGDVIRINEDRALQSLHPVRIDPFHGAPVVFPERQDIPGILNKDKFASGTAQAWWALRTRFENAWKIRNGDTGIDPEEAISLDSKLQSLDNLTQELVQVLYGYSTTNKLQIIKTPKGMKSPNMADALKQLLGRTGQVRPSGLMNSDSMLVPAVGGYGAAELPINCDIVYAVIVVSTKARDRAGAGVSFFAYDDRPGVPLMLLDWDTTELDSMLTIGWLPKVYKTLELYEQRCRARAGSLGVWMQDETAGSVLLHRAEQLRFPVRAIDLDGETRSIEEIKSDAVSRALSVSAMLQDGAVCISRQAHTAERTFKGLKQNHLLEQIKSVSTDSELDSLPLLNSFTHGVLLGKAQL
jgi:hypothetical protein